METTTRAIEKFTGEFAFLSNFYNVPLTYNGLTYMNSESAYQAQKDPSRATQFTKLPANQAKRLGRTVHIRSDWDEVKDTIMYEIVRSKFEQNPDIAQKLINTGNAEIIEGNWWNDTYWGVCNGVGQNKLGKIIMRIRKKLKTKH